MANHESAKKRIRRNSRRAKINHSRLGRIRTILKKVELALQSKDYARASEAYKMAMPELMRGKNKGIFHANSVARRLSRLNARVIALSNV